MSAMQTEEKPEPVIDRLSQDILWTIFDFYAGTDGPRDPLEKLFYVCKYWYLAARQHRRLWTKFPINITTPKDCQFWFSRASNRIKLCGKEGPAELEFNYHLLATNLNIRVFEENILKLFNMLIGHNGSLINQWSRISVEYIPSSVQRAWTEALSHPTPNLRSLKIRDLNHEAHILPCAPSLEELIIINCACTLGNDFRRLKTLELRGNSLCIPNISTTLTAKSLTTLSLLNCGRNIILSRSFLALEAVSFTAGIHASAIEQFSAPRLRSLTIYLRTEESIAALRGCDGIDFQQLEILGYGCELYSKSEAVLIMKSIKDIFRMATGIKRLRALNLKALRVFLLCIQDKINPTIECRGCPIQLLQHGYGNRFIDETFSIPPDATEEDILRVRLSANVPQDDTWAGLIDSFARF
ncbi:12254_t:CDS:1 [Acaulospora colombiana]|uniref:12253_t:CDS:1 n=2 Tax=Acaulospora colombiana TaxID=27376 RepID=A0ACA9MLJ8_9GLOM|nr:12253_t:CDS:1 [Acaulospora colombiana]CAG8596347.1 12254_t:CDS:1 [Acaulospora colombiana]